MIIQQVHEYIIPTSWESVSWPGSMLLPVIVITWHHLETCGQSEARVLTKRSLKREAVTSRERAHKLLELLSESKRTKCTVLKEVWQNVSLWPIKWSNLDNNHHWSITRPYCGHNLLHYCCSSLILDIRNWNQVQSYSTFLYRVRKWSDPQLSWCGDIWHCIALHIWASDTCPCPDQEHNKSSGNPLHWNKLKINLFG